MSTACDFVDLAQSGNYSVVTLPAQPGDYAVTVFPAQNAFCTPPVAHQRHDLASSIHQTDGAQLRWARKGHAELDPVKQRR